MWHDWVGGQIMYVVAVILITHTKGNLLCSPGIVWIVASFLSWMTWGILVLELYGLLQVSCLEWFERFMSWWLLFCCMSLIVILFSATLELCWVFMAGIIDDIIYLPLTRQILSSFPTTLLHFPTTQVLALKTYTWCACLAVFNWSFNSFGQVKIQHYSNSLMLPPCSLSEWMKLLWWATNLLGGCK